jgi:HK97 family phage major capsid protein
LKIMNSKTLYYFAVPLLAILALAGLATGTDPSHLLAFDWPSAVAGALTLANAPLAITEQLALFNAKRTAAQDGAEAIMAKSVEEGRTLDEHETEQHAGFVAEVKAIDAHIVLLKDHEQLMLSKATPILPNAGQGEGAPRVPGSSHITVKTNLPPGLRFTRFALAMAHAKGNVMLAHEIAKERYKDTPEVGNVLKAAISMGGTRDLAAIHKTAVTAVTGTDTAVTQYTDMEDEFVGLLRPKLIMGRMEQLNRVPFLMRAGRQLTGVTGGFVGEGAPKPVQKQTYDNVSLGYAKVAVIVVLSDEAVRFSTIKAEMRARDDMVKGIATYLDKRFMDPSYSGVANVSPASITNGAVRYQSSGTTLAAIDADVRNAMAMFATSDVDPATAVWVMPATVALRLSMKRTTYDEPSFPGLTLQGGTWYGLPVIVSNAMVTSGSPAELQIALVTQEEVFLADDGGVAIDMSMEASVQMNDAPSAGAQSLVSLWQNNLVGIRAEQYINWAARRTSNLGIALIENTNY